MAELYIMTKNSRNEIWFGKIEDIIKNEEYRGNYCYKKNKHKVKTDYPYVIKEAFTYINIASTIFDFSKKYYELDPDHFCLFVEKKDIDKIEREMGRMIKND